MKVAERAADRQPSARSCDQVCVGQGSSLLNCHNTGKVWARPTVVLRNSVVLMSDEDVKITQHVLI